MHSTLQPFTSYELSTAQVSALAFVAFLVALAWHYRDGRAIGTRPRSDLFAPPGQSTFLLGDLIPLVQNVDRALERFLDIKREYADEFAKNPARAMTMTVPGRRMIEVGRPELLEHVQKRNFSNYVKGQQFHDNLAPLLGHDGIFVADGAVWTLARKTTAKIFTAHNFKGVITASLETNLQKLLAVIGRHADRGEDFDLSALFFRFTLNSFAEMAFGQDLHALSTETDAPIPFAAAFDEAQVISNARFTNPLWPITEFFTGERAKMREATKVLDDFAYRVIDEREREGRGNFVGSEKKEAADKDLLSLYMALRDENGAPLTRTMLRNAILNLIIAGRDTTAQALSWTMFHLMRHDEHFQSLRKEADQTGSVDYDSFKNLVTTTACFQEGLRLHPSVPKNGWEALGDDVLPNGTRIEKGDTVFWSDWIMARDTSIWGPDAGEFNPDRWVDADGSLKKESQWKAHAFNGGYRLCLGQNLALYEGTSVLAAIAREFDFAFADNYLETTHMCDNEFTPKYKGALTLSMAAPFMVRATRRKAQ
ncbi:uncharacterized protein JCM10292_002763 [Rhodotorula paludigena]|uniref:uncharacterized protein n=1 Tax=Rhodotorula paludigena TaxID=86838 RepID=UPI003175265E